MKIAKLTAVMIAGASLALGLAAQAQEETPVAMKDLPSPVQTTIKEKVGNAQILRIAKETRNGKEVYDAVVNRNGKEVGIHVDASGRFLGTHPEKQAKTEKSKY